MAFRAISRAASIGLMAATQPTSTPAEPQSRNPAEPQSRTPPMSVVMAAMAFRVKYRKAGTGSEEPKLRHRIENLCVHPENRNGVYPAGSRCRSLCANVVDGGFAKEEFGHQLIAVEEAPVDTLRSRGTDWQSAAQYNKAASAKDDYLCSCFDEPYGEPRLMLLAHNHMCLVLRAFLTKAKWDLPSKPEKTVCAAMRMATDRRPQSRSRKTVSSSWRCSRRVAMSRCLRGRWMSRSQPQPPSLVGPSRRATSSRYELQSSRRWPP